MTAQDDTAARLDELHRLAEYLRQGDGSPDRSVMVYLASRSAALAGVATALAAREDGSR